MALIYLLLMLSIGLSQNIDIEQRGKIRSFHNKTSFNYCSDSTTVSSPSTLPISSSSSSTSTFWTTEPPSTIVSTTPSTITETPSFSTNVPETSTIQTSVAPSSSSTGFPSSSSIITIRSPLSSSSTQTSVLPEELTTVISTESEPVSSSASFSTELFSATTEPTTFIDSAVTTETVSNPSTTSETIQESSSLPSSASPSRSSIPSIPTDGPLSSVSLLSILSTQSTFNKILEEEDVPNRLSDSSISLLFKKGSPLDVTNYRPISLLSTIYKLLTSILGDRMLRTLDENQPHEQAGFRRGYSTLDHILTIKELIQRSDEYKQPLYLVFIDFEKAFDTVEHAVVWKSLYDQGVPAKIIRILDKIYRKSRVTVMACGGNVDINVKRGVRQGDTISPALFSAVLETVFRRLPWSRKGININGVKLTNLRYADDVVLLSRSANQLQVMLQSLSEKCREVGLKVNQRKTVAMSNRTEVPLYLEGQRVDYKKDFIYLGSRISFDRNESLELTRRVQAGWYAFNRYHQLLTSKRIPVELKKRVYISCVEPALLYGCETWILRQRDATKLIVAQRRMMRRMLHVSLMDRRTNEWLHRRCPLPDIRRRCAERKWYWAKQIAEGKAERWTRRILEWRPWLERRPRGRPKARWADNFVEHAGRNWFLHATESHQWRQSMIRHVTTLIS